jgi:PKD repeat protein
MHSTQVIAGSSRLAFMRRLTRLAGLPIALAAMTIAGCTDKSDGPAPTGPSELGLSLIVTASPDVLDIDGLSQSTIAISARGPDGAPLANVGLNLDIISGGEIVDLGRLSSKSAVTGSDGFARVTYTAPAGAPSGNSDGLFVVKISAIPAGNDFQNAVPRTVDIRLKPRGVILPQPFAPVPRFTFSPTAPGEDVEVRFDASLSIASCKPDPTDPNNADKCSPQPGGIVSYLWDFGNGRTGSGVQAKTFYSTAGTYNVKLTVTNDRGLTNSAIAPITVSAVAGPTASFTLSPQTVGVNERVNVDASASKANADRFIIEYNWSWGDGGRSQGQLSNHRYAQAGSYTITLTVVDSSGRTGTSTQSVSVGAGQLPTAAFNFSPTVPVRNSEVFFDATVSTAPPGRTIVTYDWNFGDGTAPVVGPDPRPRHTYTAAGSYVVTLTVTDSATARSLAVTRNLTVTP